MLDLLDWLDLRDSLGLLGLLDRDSLGFLVVSDVSDLHVSLVGATEHSVQVCFYLILGAAFQGLSKARSNFASPTLR